MSSLKRKRSFQEERMADLLYTKIRTGRRSLRDVSRDLGLPANKLSQILSGYLRLEIGMVYDVLSVLGLHPDVFFTELNAELVPAEQAAEEALMPEGPISRSALERLIDERLRVMIEKSIEGSAARGSLGKPSVGRATGAPAKTAASKPAKKSSPEGKNTPRARRKS